MGEHFQFPYMSIHCMLRLPCKHFIEHPFFHIRFITWPCQLWPPKVLCTSSFKKKIDHGLCSDSLQLPRWMSFTGFPQLPRWGTAAT